MGDSARVNGWVASVPVVEENFYLEPPSSRFPTVHFRHLATANVLFADGHVESPKPSINPIGPWTTDAEAGLAQVKQIFDVGETDDLWDRE
jgi:prepilin-type processing-associated H-X9-DG protein